MTWGVFAGAWAETALPHAGPWRRRASRVSGIPVRSTNAWWSGEQRLLRNAQPLLPLRGLIPIRAVGAVPRQQDQRRDQCSEPRCEAGGGQGRPHGPLRAPQRGRPARTSDAPRDLVLSSRGRSTRRPGVTRFERARWRGIGHVSTTSVLAAGGVWPVRTGDQMDGRRRVWRSPRRVLSKFRRSGSNTLAGRGRNPFHEGGRCGDTHPRFLAFPAFPA